jgi:hypothetical protein
VRLRRRAGRSRGRDAAAWSRSAEAGEQLERVARNLQRTEELGSRQN